ncbi:MAG: NADAR family protein [Halothece sp. Uz-M2-17]|nr:NADAR family protein [Halothece sp. Uz-M2-17]
MAIYFYKADQPYGCFSNFSPHPVTIDGKQWPTVEHYYQAHKLLGTPDEFLMEVIRQVTAPEEAAAIGRDRARTIRVDWNTAKQSVMWNGVLTKFLTHKKIQNTLLNTGEEWLIENSPRDYYWGCGKDGSGQNHLGRMLMQVRSQIRKQIAQTQQDRID